MPIHCRLVGNTLQITKERINGTNTPSLAKVPDNEAPFAVMLF